MTDFTRPNSQWQDLPRSASALKAWHLVYTEDGTTGTLAAASGARRRLGTGLIVSDSVTVGDETVQTWTVAPQVNGEVEAQVAYLQGVVYITG